MTIRVGINGFGRIGRNFFRAVRQSGADVEIVAANDLGSVEVMAHLLGHDSVMGPLDADITTTDEGIVVDGKLLRITAIRNPAELPWAEMNVDVVVESTGFFTTRDAAAAHLEAGAPFVIVSAPCTGADATFVVGVNDDTFDPATHKVVSNASCTTNCFVPLVKVLDDAFGVQRGLMTTVHAYTGDQNLVDGPHTDLRRARASAINITPSSTGAARATGLVLESMQGKLDGTALRVPVPDGSVTDFVGLLSREVTVDEVNAAFASAASTERLGKVLKYSEKPLVSTDIVGDPSSCVYDAPLTMVMGDLVKVLGWYDNEWGYSNRLVDLCQVVGAANQ
jgi:glyceraldehyde 3-phosphate dehydrogenase